MKRAQWGKNKELRKRRAVVWLEPNLIDKVRIEAKEKNISCQRVLEAGIYDRYDEMKQEERDALIVRRLNRLDHGQKNLTHSLEILAEAFASYVRMWLANTQEVPESQREAAAIQAHARFERYMASLSRQVQKGEWSFGEITGETSISISQK